MRSYKAKKSFRKYWYLNSRRRSNAETIPATSAAIFKAVHRPSIQEALVRQGIQSSIIANKQTKTWGHPCNERGK